MVKFEHLGFSSFDEYTQYFFESLLETNKTFEYYVDWTKVKKDVKQYTAELSLLNSLTRLDFGELKDALSRLLKDYPQVVEVLPLLVAERLRNIEIFDIETEAITTFVFEKEAIDDKSIEDIVEFSEKVGIISLLSQVKDVIDYLLGVEVGLDTNARKNRSGEIFEKMCGEKLKKILPDDYNIVHNDKNFSLYQKVFTNKRKAKTHDYVLYKTGFSRPLIIIECNFYNVQGSKPISIAESYIKLFEAAQNERMEFIWVTDGPAWKKMREPLIRSMTQINWVLNYRLMSFLPKILERM